jgi:hypothetical protein
MRPFCRNLGHHRFSNWSRPGWSESLKDISSGRRRGTKRVLTWLSELPKVRIQYHEKVKESRSNLVDDGLNIVLKHFRTRRFLIFNVRSTGPFRDKEFRPYAGEIEDDICLHWFGRGVASHRSQGRHEVSRRVDQPPLAPPVPRLGSSVRACDLPGPLASV